MRDFQAIRYIFQIFKHLQRMQTSRRYEMDQGWKRSTNRQYRKTRTRRHFGRTASVSPSDKVRDLKEGLLSQADHPRCDARRFGRVRGGMRQKEVSNCSSRKR